MNFQKPIPILSLLCGVLFAILTTACGEREFKIKGEIANAENETVSIEKSDFNGNWQTLDSTRLSSKGSFSMSLPSPAAPEIYRLRINDNYIYFPVDSTETIAVDGSMPALAVNYSLSGSEQAARMSEFDHELTTAISGKADLTDFKRKVFNKYIRDGKGSLLSYYVLTKTINNQPLYDPEDDNDIKYYTAVATAFKEFRPDDPRVKILEQTAISALRKRNSRIGKQRILTAEKETSHIEINLPGIDGANKKLSSLLSNGKRTLVVFSLMNHPDAPIINKKLFQLFNNGAINIYQVSLDADQFAWRESATNLPWINVFDPEGDTSTIAGTYNVRRLPAFFLYDASGNLIDRADDLATLDLMMKK